MRISDWSSDVCSSDLGESSVKYIPIAGLLLAAWGLITLDWVKIGLGLLIFLGAFAIDTYKKLAVLKDDILFAAHHALPELTRLVRQSFDITAVDTARPKPDLAPAHFCLGRVAASLH